MQEDVLTIEELGEELCSFCYNANCACEENPKYCEDYLADEAYKNYLGELAKDYENK